MSTPPLHVVVFGVDTPSPRRKREYTTCRAIQDDFLESSKRGKPMPVAVAPTPPPPAPETDERFGVLMRAESVAYLASPVAQLVESVDPLLALHAWLVDTSCKHKLSPHTAFVAANIMQKYLCQLDHTGPLEKGLLVCASCLIVADKLDNANGHLFPSTLIGSETSLEPHTVKQFVAQEMHILTTLRWEFANIHAPHTFADCFFGAMDLHAKIRKTTRRCMQHCLVSRDCVLLMPSQVAVYSLMASCLHHNNTVRYGQICAEYARYQADTAHTERMCKRILDAIHTLVSVPS